MEAGGWYLEDALRRVQHVEQRQRALHLMMTANHRQHHRRHTRVLALTRRTVTGIPCRLAVAAFELLPVWSCLPSCRAC